MCTARSSSAKRGSFAAGVATLIVFLTGACVPDRLPRPAAPAPTAPFTVVNPPTPAVRPVICTGSEAQDLLRMLFAEIDAGRTPPVAVYFTTPDAFLSWWDPTLVPDSVITVETDNGTAALQAHLDALARAGAALSMTRFASHGYRGGGGRDAGGQFTFDVRGRPDSTASLSSGAGEGMIDCYSGKIKQMSIDQW